MRIEQIPISVQNPARLAAVRRTALIDSPNDEAFDRLARLAARMVRAPVAMVVLINGDKHFLKSCVGVPEPLASTRELPLCRVSFCQCVVASELPLIVSDARIHPLGQDNMPVNLLGVTAYLGIPIRLSTGEVLGSFCVIDFAPRAWTQEDVATMQDIAAAVMTEIELRTTVRERDEQMERLREEDRRKDEFLAMLAHELRNPLAPLLTALQMMRLRIAQPQDHERYVVMAERQVRRLTRLVDDLLDVSRITRGKVELRRRPIALGQVLQRAVETASPFIRARGLLLCVSHPPESCLLLADADRLEQVFVNLLNNAAKYTEPGGTLTLRSELEGSTAVVRVKDTGIGIEPEKLSRVFDLFMQANPSIDRRHGGLGVGLTLVRALVEMHGGSVEAVSEGLERGSEFIIRLPSLDQTADKPASSQAGASTMPRSSVLKVLVVDDNTDAAAILGEALSAMGHIAYTARDGYEAVELARQHLPDAVLLDIGLPGLDGYQTAKRLQGLGLEVAPRLFALTGYGQLHDRMRSHEVGIERHLVKPVDLEELFDLLRESPVASA